MAEKSFGGTKKISVTLRPRSAAKTQKPGRRKQAATSTAAVFADPTKHHSATSFPLFSSNLLAKKPPPAQSKSQSNEATRTKQSITVNHATRLKFHSSDARSPTPVEQSTSHTDTQLSLSSVSKLSLKSDVIPVTGRYGVVVCSESERSLTATPTSDICGDIDSEDVFPIRYLPDDCLLKIFSLLPSHDKGRCAQVSGGRCFT